MLDVNLGLEDGANKIFLTLHSEKVYISVGGLAFNDIIYSSDFINTGYLKFELDSAYSRPDGLIVKYDVLDEIVE